jgi:hypothetical protein
VATKLRRRGQPPKDDSAALEEIRKERRKLKNLTAYAAAFKYAEKHQEKGVAITSTARRLADKLKAESGIPKRLTDASLRADLMELRQALLKVVQIVDRMINRLPKHPRK